MTPTRPDDGARLDAVVRGVRLRVRAWIWAEEGLRGLAVGLAGASALALLAKVTAIAPILWTVPAALGVSTAVRGALARRFGPSESALLLDRVSEAQGEVFTAFEGRNAWLLARAAERVSSIRMPLVPRGVPRTLWPAVALVGVLASTPLLPDGQAIAIPRAREAQVARIERAAELASPDPSMAGRLRALAREVRGGEASRIGAAVDDLVGAVNAARRRAQAADVVSQAAGGASSAREAAERSVGAPETMREGLGRAIALFPEGEAPEELSDALRALDEGDVEALAGALDRLLDAGRRLDADTLERLAARVEAIRADLGGAAASANGKGAAGAAGTGATKKGAPPAAAPPAPLDLPARLREAALRRPTWPRELDPVVQAYFGGSVEVHR